jgi:hypothetical protein
MSEMDLIKKLERLQKVKPSQEWVAFTKANILYANEASSRQFFFSNFRFTTLAGVLTCVIAGFVVSVLLTPANEIKPTYHFSASTPVQEIIEAEPLKEQEIEVAKEEQEVVVEEEINISALGIQDNNAYPLREMELEAEWYDKKVRECRRLEEQGLLEGENMEECLEYEDALNHLRRILSSENN